MGWRSLALGMVAALGLALPVVAADRAIIVLDGSGSMWAQIEGKARITIARETLASVLKDLPDDLELGLMSYGHREKGNCDDIEMLVEPGPGAGPAIVAAADEINPKGKTPISEAVRRAAEALQFTEDKATVILITDGLETCEVDPCQLASELESQGVDFTTHVLGFGLSDEEGQQVACLAENTGGRYLSAQDGDALVDALSATVAEVAEAEPAPEPEPKQEPAAVNYTVAPSASLTEGGPDLVDDNADISWNFHSVLEDGSAGEWLRTEYHSGAKIDMEPGNYILRAKWGEVEQDQPVTVTADEVIEPHFVLNAGLVKVRAFAAEGEPVADGAPLSLTYPGGEAYGYGEENFRVPAGDLTLTVKVGAGEVTESFTLAAGETIEKNVVVGVGVAAVKAEYVPGMAVDAGIWVDIQKAKKALDGSRESVANGYGGEQQFELTPGDYVAVYQLDGAKGELPFTVEGGQQTDVALTLNAGVLAATIPSNGYVEAQSAKKNLEGNRESFGGGYGPEFSLTLPAGDYVLALEVEGAKSESPVTVSAGERTEVTLEAPKAGKTK
ncbi:vWA domain-containing protein [Devosia aquimaris]|uniref:vWA domain-containing protein n=1 Tax=Devosia aquimaris TaxID=2866214 RepID=UPI001CD16416|nr:VWA domain-containing protein [Devosia sp. CJK-A8-3]